MKFKLIEALHGFDEIDEYTKTAKEIGLKTLKDVKDFKDREGGAELKDIKRVRKELGPDFKIKESKKCNVDLDEALGLKEGISKDMTAEDIAKKHNVSVKAIKAQVKKGIKVEKEHTDDEKKAERIALDHLFEIPNYYDKLDKMEKSALKEETEKEIRFIPVDRYAIDGRRWYVVYDKQENKYASFPTFFGKYTTKKDCQYAINKFVEKYPNYKYIDAQRKAVFANGFKESLFTKEECEEKYVQRVDYYSRRYAVKAYNKLKELGVPVKPMSWGNDGTLMFDKQSPEQTAQILDTDGIAHWWTMNRKAVIDKKPSESKELKEELDDNGEELWQPGDIVRIKKEWLEKYEDPNKDYIVFEDYGNGRVKVFSESKHSIFGGYTNVWGKEMMYKIGHIDLDQQKKNESLKEDTTIKDGAKFVVTTDGNDIKEFNKRADAIKFAKKENAQQVETRYKDSDDYEIVWFNNTYNESLKESLQVLTQEEIESGKDRWVETEEDEKVWNSLPDEDKELLVLSNDMGTWFDEIQPNDDLLDRYYDLRYKFSKFKNPANNLKESTQTKLDKAYGRIIVLLDGDFAFFFDKEAEKLSDILTVHEGDFKGINSQIPKGRHKYTTIPAYKLDEYKDRVEIIEEPYLKNDLYESQSQGTELKVDYAPLKDRKPHKVFVPGDHVKYVNNDGWTDSGKQDIGRTGVITDSHFVGNEETFEIKADDYREYRGYADNSFIAHPKNLKFVKESLEEELKVDDFVRIKKGNDIKDDVSNDYVGELAYIDEIVEDENSAKISICDSETQLWIPLDCLEKIDESDYKYIEDDLDEKLIQGKSDATLKKNIKTEIESGKDPKQAYAIAKSIQDKHLKESAEGDAIAQANIDSKNDNFEKDKETTREVRKELAKQGIATVDDFNEDVIEYSSKILEDDFDNISENEFEDSVEDDLSDEEVEELECFSENVAKLLNNNDTVINEGQEVKTEIKVEINNNEEVEDEEVVDYVNPNISEQPKQAEDISIDEIKGE